MKNSTRPSLTLRSEMVWLPLNSCLCLVRLSPSFSLRGSDKAPEGTDLKDRFVLAQSFKGLSSLSPDSCSWASVRQSIMTEQSYQLPGGGREKDGSENKPCPSKASPSVTHFLPSGHAAQ